MVLIVDVSKADVDIATLRAKLQRGHHGSGPLHRHIPLHAEDVRVDPSEIKAKSSK